MFCIKCGLSLDDDSLFCPNCGTRVVEIEEESLQSKETADNILDSNKDEEKRITDVEKKDEKPKTLSNKQKNYTICGLVGLIIVGIIAVVLNRKPAIDLNSYITVEASGYNTLGEAVIKFDVDSFRNDFNNISFETKEPEPEFEDGSFEEFMYGLKESMKENEDIMDDIKWELNQTEGLSNGDVIEIKWVCNDEHVKEKYGCVLKYKDISYKVENLTIIETIDPFEGIELKISEDGDYIKYDVINNNQDDARSAIKYTVEKKNNVKNGDSVDLVVISDAKDFLKQYGIVWDRDRKSYVVSGLKEKIETISQITDNQNLVNELYEKANSICNNMKIIVPEGYGRVDIEEIKPIGLGFYYDNGQNSNYAFVVDKVKVHYELPRYNMIDDWEIYCPVEFSEVSIDKDGHIDYDSDHIASPADKYNNDLDERRIYYYGIEGDIQVTVKYEGYAAYEMYNAIRHNGDTSHIQFNFDEKSLVKETVPDRILGQWSNATNYFDINSDTTCSVFFSADGRAGLAGNGYCDWGTYSVDDGKITIKFDDERYYYFPDKDTHEYLPAYTAHLEIRDGLLYYLDGFNEYIIQQPEQFYHVN